MGYFGNRVAVTILAAWSLAGCAAAYDPEGFWNSATFWKEGQASDQSLAAFAKGDTQGAEQFAADALRRNPKDPYALLALAQVYQATGRPELSRQYYESIAALKPQGNVISPTGQTTTLQEVAEANLAQMRARDAAARKLPAPMPSPGDVGPAAGRFIILRRLLQEALVTQEEYDTRRAANLGVLLPYSAPPPAAGLDRAIPAADQIVERLRALARGLETRAISPREHAAERGVILEALMPAVPKAAASAPPPVRDMIAAAAAVGRIERLAAAQLITAEEAAKEREAVDKAFLAANPPPKPAPVLGAGPQSLVPDGFKAAAPAASGGALGIGVHLASLRSEDQAVREWAALVKRYPAELRGLKPTVTRVDLGPKGIFFRLIGGPVASQAEAKKICGALKKARQFCDQATIG